MNYQGSISPYVDTPLEAIYNFQKTIEDYWKTHSHEVGTKTFSPKVEIVETISELWILFDLSGFVKEDISVEIHDNRLFLTCLRNRKKIENEIKVHYSEFPYGEFQRTIKLPINCDVEKVSAGFDDGILTIIVDKEERSKPREVVIS